MSRFRSRSSGASRGKKQTGRTWTPGRPLYVKTVYIHEPAISDEEMAAARVICGHARDKDEAREFLLMMGICR